MASLSRCGLGLLLLAALACGEELTGTVTDAAGLPVPGAKVSFGCAPGRRTSRTDSEGRFVFHRTESRRCPMAVSHPGFETYNEMVDGGARALSVRLNLATLRQVVNVSAEPEPVLQQSFSAVSLSEAELRRLSDSTQDLIRYAALLAGPGAAAAIYVDGMPATVLPPAYMISRITANANPFSAEYADGDETRIEVTTKNADRQFRFHAGSGSLGAGGGNVLAPGQRASSHSGNWGLSGPVPLTPLTFSANLSLADSASPLNFAVATGSHPSAPAQGSAKNGIGSGGLQLYYAGGDHFHLKLSHSEIRSHGSEMGVGGLVLPEAGWNTLFGLQQSGATANLTWGSLILSSGFAMNSMDSENRANSGDAGITVAGAFTAGGAPMTTSVSQRSSWSWKNVLEENAWRAGVVVARSEERLAQTPNAYGQAQFSSLASYQAALEGSDTATWLVTRGAAAIRYASVTATPFVERTLWKSANGLLAAGVRADYESGFGWMPSPRISAAIRRRGFVLRAGGGQFVRTLPGSLFTAVLEKDGQHLQQFLFQNASLSDAMAGTGESLSTVRAQFGPGLERPRQWMGKASVERPMGNASAGVEYTWTRDLHLLGSRRLGDAADFVDFLESDRAAERQRIQTRLTYRIRGQRLFAAYDWIRSRDNTDGPFSFPARQDDLRDEWARSAGISPHNVTLAGTFQLPRAVYLTLTDAWRGPAPFNITTGLDAENDGLYTDRGGRPRNSGNGPGYNSLAIYGSRRVGIPVGERKLFVNIGVQGDNLLNNRNYLIVNSVVGSPGFGRPMAAMQGRSVRLWIGLD